jgi:hypothetical protein
MRAVIDSQMIASYNIEEVFQEDVQQVSSTDERTFLDWLSICKGEGAIKWQKIKKQQSVIDKFIQSEPKIQPVKGVLNDIRDFDAENKSSKKENAEMIVSETLANIYYQQKKFSLCIETYRKLSLLYPEKSAYFASLIKKIEKEQEL